MAQRNFLDQVRSGSMSRLANIQRRQSRLRGRPLTQEQQAAPYEALAATSGQRLAQERALNLQEQGQEQETGLAERRLDQQASQFQDQMAANRERLAQQQAQFEEQQRLAQEQMEEQMRAAQMAREADESAQTMQLIGTGLGAGAALLGGTDLGGSIMSGVGDAIKNIGSTIGGFFGSLW